MFKMYVALGSKRFPSGHNSLETDANIVTDPQLLRHKDFRARKDYLKRVKGLKLKPEDNIWIDVESPFKPLHYDGFTAIAMAISKRSGVPFSWYDARRGTWRLRLKRLKFIQIGQGRFAGAKSE